MPIPHNKTLTANARSLRREMTKEEKQLWYQFLKPLSIMVHRQKVILNYIADFYIDSKKIVIELDGRQHLTPENKAADEKRDADLAELGITVLRYPNKLIHTDFYQVCHDIGRHCGLYLEN